jgi:hypothetical protein
MVVLVSQRRLLVMSPLDASTSVGFDATITRASIAPLNFGNVMKFDITFLLVQLSA